MYLHSKLAGDNFIQIYCSGIISVKVILLASLLCSSCHSSQLNHAVGGLFVIFAMHFGASDFSSKISCSEAQLGVKQTSKYTNW